MKKSLEYKNGIPRLAFAYRQRESMAPVDLGLNWREAGVIQKLEDQLFERILP